MLGFKKTPNRPCSYSFCFSQANKDYATWKAKLIGNHYYEYDLDRYDKRTNKNYQTRQIIIKMDKKLKEHYYNLFYKPCKQINLEILNQLDDIGICIWYLDDGSVYYNGNNCHITLSVNGFTLEERDLIIKWFKEKYDLNFKKSQKAIRITSKKDCEKFMDIVEKYIPDCMSYKKLKNRIKRYYNEKQNIHNS